MNLGVTLKTAEKVFGPALPGPGDVDKTLSAVRYAGAKGKKFAGVPGIQEDAKFCIHFPTPVDWNLLQTKKGTPDFVNDLKESGPQGEQGRAIQVEKFKEGYEQLREKLRLKQAAANKKAQMAQMKEETLLIRKRLAPFIGNQQVTLILGTESISLSIKISMDKAGKLKLAATL